MFTIVTPEGRIKSSIPSKKDISKDIRIISIDCPAIISFECREKIELEGGGQIKICFFNGNLLSFCTVCV